MCITLCFVLGQIIKQEWDDCEYILQLNPLAHISNEKPLGNERLLLNKVWHEDMHLFSAFLDSKVNASSLYCMITVCYFKLFLSLKPTNTKTISLCARAPYMYPVSQINKEYSLMLFIQVLQCNWPC